MTPLLEVSDLRKEYPSRGAPWGAPRPPVKAVDGVSFTVARGETLGLVGESGSGKSTTGRLILRLLEPTGGWVRFDGLPVEELRGRALFAFRRRAQMVFQDPFSSLNPRHTIGQILAEPLKLHRICPPGEVTARVRGLLQRVGLRAEHAERYPHEFSGGQRQRIGIARALSLGPELIVADEPVSALDVSVQAQILNLLQEIQAEEKLAMLFIAHDLAVVRRVSHRIAVMLNGQLVETGPAEEVCLRPQHPYTRALIASVPGIEWSAENRSPEVS